MVTMEMIEWREHELENAVEFLNIANPKGYTAEEIKRHAFAAFAETGEPTFVGTAGWYVSIVKKSYESEKPFIALVSIMAYSALKFANKRGA